MSSSRRGVISDSLAAARNVRPWLQTGELGVPESKVWQALRGAPAEAASKPGRHRRCEDELDHRR
ncbi:hypothetical protein [Saccharopolyspora griseoalba]|uniref:Uncharacterized protein n=1 Tax=Saccharopolyspora griseoalba TaxID=1431848 RepID=A0ABW2LP95_9PSEU